VLIAGDCHLATLGLLARRGSRTIAGSLHSRSTDVIQRADAVGMTTSLYVTGTHVASVEHDPHRDSPDLRRAGTLAHAVARPVVDGLAASVCGVLVTAIADMDWHDVWAASRCAECQRIAG
jgi:hypothetical protein